MMLETLCNLFVRYPVVRIEQVGCPYEKTGNDRGTIEYDYIVVGGECILRMHRKLTLTTGGTAGCVIANRLSAHRDMKVLLLERGAIGASLLGGNVLLSFPGIGTVPAKEMKLAPQKNLNGKEMKMYEGLSLGGRSSINGSLYLQGCPEEYATWGKGWQWDDVAPLFARFERRLELEPRDNLDPDHEGGEWKTRYVEPQFRSSKEYDVLFSWVILGSRLP
jgi:choline dehydrogenase-like flavoprotein